MVIIITSQKEGQLQYTKLPFVILNLHLLGDNSSSDTENSILKIGPCTFNFAS